MRPTTYSRATSCAAVLALAGLASSWMPAARTSGHTFNDPFAWFSEVVNVNAEDRRRLNRREIVSRSLPAEGGDLALFLASAIRVDAQTFARKSSQPEELWVGKGVPHVVRFSVPPRLEDVARLELDRSDLDDLYECRPGDCDLKLSAPEIQRVHAAIARAPNAWHASVQREFRRIVLDRAVAYSAGGFDSFEPYADQQEPVMPSEADARLIRDMPIGGGRWPQLASYLREYPSNRLTGAESFLFWLKTTYTPKPTIQIVHLITLEGDSTEGTTPAVLVVSRQVYATHYMNAWLSVSALLRDPGWPSRTYLAYLNRSHLDGLDSWFSGIRRYLVERRVRASAERILEIQRQRIERR